MKSVKSVVKKTAEPSGSGTATEQAWGWMGFASFASFCEEVFYRRARRARRMIREIRACPAVNENDFGAGADGISCPILAVASVVRFLVSVSTVGLTFGHCELRFPRDAGIDRLTRTHIVWCL